MKVVAFVPMKLNNTRLPNKNTKPFTNGEPLCHYILKTLLEVKGISEIYVYCSDESICQHIPAGIKFLKRSTDLDKDTTTMNEVLSGFSEAVNADVYVLAHATTPFLEAKSIEKGINTVLNEGYDSAFSVKAMQDFFWKDNKPFNYSLDNIPRTQDLPPIYCETCGLYIYKKEIIDKFNRRIGNHPFMITVSEIEAMDIDTSLDFEIADAIYNRVIKKEKKGNEHKNT